MVTTTTYTRRWTALPLAIVILVAAVGCSRQEGQPGKAQTGQSPVAEADRSDQPTVQLFNRRCSSCHGRNGNGLGGRGGPSLQRETFTYGRTHEAIVQSIRDGRPNGMPAFGHAFTPDQIESLASFILSLK